MEYKLNEINSYQRVLELTWSSEEVEKELKKKLEEYKKKLILPGFRPGKAPLGLIKSRFGKVAKEELSETLFKEGYKEALEKTNLKPINEGKMDIISELEEDKPFQIKIELEVKPDIKLLNYRGYKLKRVEKKVTKKDVDREIKVLRERVATFEKPQRDIVQEDDLVVALTPGESGEKKQVQFDLSEKWTGRLFKGLVGMKVGEKKKLEIEYPNDFYIEELRGTKKTFDIRVKKIFEKKYPKTNKVLLERLGGQFKTFAQLTRHIKKELEKKAKASTEKAVEEQVTDLLLKDNPVEAPPSLVKFSVARFIATQYTKEEIEKLTEEKYKQLYDKLHPHAQRAVVKELILDAIAKAEGLEVSNDEFDKWLSDEAEKLGTTRDTLTEYLTEKGELETRREELTRRKALKFVLDKSEIINEEEV